MNDPSYYSAFDSLTGEQMVWYALWLGLAFLTVLLLVLMRTRWGQAQPLRKCVFLSLLAHLLMAGYATTVKIVAVAAGAPPEPAVTIRTIDTRTSSETPAEQRQPQEAKPWEQFVPQDVVEPASAEMERQESLEVAATEREQQIEAVESADDLPLQEMPEVTAPLPVPTESPDAEVPSPQTATDVAADIEAPEAQRRDAPTAPQPEAATPQREALTLDESAPSQRPLSDLPADLLQPMTPLPQVAQQVTSPQPADAMKSLVDLPSNPDAAQMPAPAEAASAPETNSPNAADDASVAESGQRDSDAMADESDSGPEPNTTAVDGSSVATSEAGTSTIPGESGTLGPDRAADVPPLYQLRVADNRARRALAQGATRESEECVAAALAWLATQQSADGRWDPSRHDAGRESRIDGHDRGGAGADADTGITGLVLLAFLGAGHTHQDGDYIETVRAGLEYLRRVQGADGNLGGTARSFAFMYCHGMATLAVSEAYAMTGDSRLADVVNAAIGYTVAAQHPQTGGWRYRPWQHVPSDGGDTSQLGWQLMALRSAEMAGVAIPAATNEGTVRFLKAVATGAHGGQATYRPGERVSRTMTAEALFCRQLMGMSRANRANDEAAAFLLGELPGSGRANFYYWYYATLAMYQLGGQPWQTWNDALQETLVAGQQKRGAKAGSWSPDSVWGGYGGRIYSTAMGTLCLEVYYRYLPLYRDVGDVP
mgnify:CR=1 FL=1